jgi:uncharacterized protein YeaO (DUF488 family)
MIELKRAYENPSLDDGFRVLVERLWPRGLSKENAQLDLWLKDVAPSPELRQWYGHDPAKWTEFQKRYRAELKEKKYDLNLLKEKSRGGDHHAGLRGARPRAQQCPGTQEGPRLDEMRGAVSNTKPT